MSKEIYPKLSNILNKSFSNIKEWLSGIDIRFSSPSSPTFQILNGIRWIYSQILYYMEDVVSEQNLITASRPESIYGIASSFGYEATRSMSSNGFLEIKTKIPTEQIGTSIRLKNFTSFRNKSNGLNYIIWMDRDFISLDVYSNQITKIFAYQGVLIKKQILAIEKELYTISIETSKSISNEPILIFVNGELWNVQESLYDMGKYTKGYLIRNNYLGGFNLIFGNGNFGLIPKEGSIIEIIYIETNGVYGNFNELTSFEPIGTALTYPTNQIINLSDNIIVNSNEFSFGSNDESIELTKQMIPKSSKSSLLSLSHNYQHFLSKYSSILKTITKETKDESKVSITIFPNFLLKIKSKNSYFDLKESDFIPSNQFIQKIYNLLEKSGKIIMTGKVEILKPTIEKFALIFYIKPIPNFERNSLKTDLIESITNHIINRENQNKIQRSDLIAIAENIKGIDSVNVSISKENPNLIQNGFGDFILDENCIAWITGDFYDSNGIYFKKQFPNGNGYNPITIFFVG